MAEAARPVEERERIVALDVLRGVALLGILIMNVQAFSMPSAAYTNPNAYGDLEGINRAVWVVSHVVADQKFMAIFSMLFGAGVCLFVDRAKAKGASAPKLHYRRTLLLLLVGLAHGYLLFYGEILTHYALCALWVFLFRNRSPRTLVIVAVILLMVPSAFSWFMGVSIPHMPPEAIEGMKVGWAPNAEQLAKTVAGMTGSFSEQFTTRARTTVMLQTVVFVMVLGWRITALMLLGMALYKTGVITGEKDDAWYRRLAMIGLPLGIALSSYGVWQNFAHDWTFEYSMFFGGIPNYWGSLGIALGYVALVMLAVRRGLLGRAQAVLAATGRMAFTNYIAQSLICLVIFNIFDLYGAMPRWQQALLVPAIWAAQLAFSTWWLTRYRYGPLEWLWRSATYGTIGQLRRS